MENEKKAVYQEMAKGFCDTVYEEGPEISELPDTFLWKKPIENMISSLHYDHLKLPRYQGLLLFGDRGNGKHTLSDAYVQSVCKSEMCFEKSVYIRLRAEDFNAKQLTSVDEINGFIDALFETCGMTGEHSFLVFDQMDSYSEITVVCNGIADALMAASEKIHVICIAEDFRIIPSELSKLLLRCSCPDPDERLRKKYFEERLSFHVEDWVYGSDYRRTIKLQLKDLSAGELVSLTEGFSFAMLGEFVQVLKMNISDRTLGEEPVCTIEVSREEALGYLHMLAPDLPAGGTVPQIIYRKPQETEAGAAARKEADTEIQKLIHKGGSRSVEENLQLIDAVPVMKNSGTGTGA